MEQVVIPGVKKIKCLVWDLDNTVWDGVLLEDSNVALRPGVVDVIRTLDERGILQSIASKNDYATGMDQLKKLGIDEYFIYPEINWNAKSSSIQQIANNINIGLDTIAFIDDQLFERDEVNYHYPQLLCLDAADLGQLLELPEMNPLFITEDSKLRRSMYMSDISRNETQKSFIGTEEEFLASLNMQFTIAPVVDGDLERAEELTVRTHQLNATGYTYSFDELNHLRQSDDHLLFISSLEDIYGTYGKIGLALIECNASVWRLKLLLMSCRVMSRGVGTIMLNYVMRLAKEKNVRLEAEFVPTDRNRMMLITYKFAGFKESRIENGVTILENDLQQIQSVPAFVTLQVKEY